MVAKRLWLQESEKASVRSKVRFRSFAFILALTFFAGNLATARAADSDAYLFARHDAAVSIMRSAAVGNPEAQTHLGYLYYKGRSVPQDYAAAAYWLTRAAEQGEPTAQFLLGLLYDKGQGVEQDFARAYFWLNLSAAHPAPGDRDFRMRVRNSVRDKLMGQEVIVAQELASHWRPIPER